MSLPKLELRNKKNPKSKIQSLLKRPVEDRIESDALPDQGVESRQPPKSLQGLATL